jgi:ankyrin repeat protein
MYLEYLSSNATSPLKLSPQSLSETLKSIKKYEPNTFIVAENEITQSVKEIYSKFISSSIWKEYQMNNKWKESSSADHDFLYPIKNIPSIHYFIEKKKKKKKKKEEGEVIQKVNHNFDQLPINDKLYESIQRNDKDLFFKIMEQDDAVHVDLEKKYENKMSLLHLAVKNNQTKICEYLIHCGADINNLDSQMRTPLHIASNLGYHDLCIILLGNGAKINVRDVYGFSPVLLCLKSHHFHIVSDLKLFGGDINFKRDNGMTILHEAM